jgi:hypothetical protein
MNAVAPASLRTGAESYKCSSDFRARSKHSGAGHPCLESCADGLQNVEHSVPVRVEGDESPRWKSRWLIITTPKVRLPSLYLRSSAISEPARRGRSGYDRVSCCTTAEALNRANRGGPASDNAFAGRPCKSGCGLIMGERGLKPACGCADTRGPARLLRLFTSRIEVRRLRSCAYWA